MWVAILPLVALCRGQETQQALSGLLEAAGSVQSSSESFGSSVGSAKTIADYPQEVKEARQCMLDLFPLLTTSLETIALIPFAPLQTGARGAKTVMEAGKTTFESSTKLIPTVATAAEGVSRQMQTLQSTATKASLAITVFKAIVTRGQSLLEQMVQLVNFGAALDAVKAQIQSFFEELVTVLPSQVNQLLSSSIMGWMGFTSLQGSLNMQGILRQMDSVPTFDTTALQQSVTTASQVAIDEALQGLLTVQSLVAAASADLEKQVKSSVRQVGRLFSGLAAGSSSDSVAVSLMNRLLLRPLNEALKDLMTSFQRSLVAWIDLSPPAQQEVQDGNSSEQSEGLSAEKTQEVFAEAEKSFAMWSKAAVDSTYPSMLTTMKSSVGQLAEKVLTNVKATCITEAPEPVACVTSVVKKELESHMVQFKDLVLQAIPSNFMDQVIQDVGSASNVSNTMVAALLMDGAGLPKMGQDAKDLQEQLKVKVEEAVVRAQQRADELFGAQGLPSGLAAVFGIITAWPDWKKGLRLIFESTIGTSMVSALQGAISTAVATGLSTVNATVLNETDRALEDYFVTMWNLTASQAQQELMQVAKPSLSSSMRPDEQLLVLTNQVKDMLLTWVLAKKESLATVLDNSSSLDVDTLLASARSGIEELKSAVSKVAEPLAGHTKTLSDATGGLSSFKTSAETVLNKLKAACTPADQFKTALNSITSWLDAEYCLSSVLDSLGCIGGQSIGFTTLPRVCAKDYISKSAYCMVPSKLLSLEVCVTVPDACSCLATALGNDALRICLGASTVSNLVSAAFNAAIEAANVGDWNPGIDFDIPTMPEMNFPDVSNILNFSLEMPDSQLPQLLVKSDGTIMLGSWMTEGYNIFSKSIQSAITSMKEYLRTSMKLENVADAANMIENADFKAGLAEAFANRIGVNASSVTVSLSLSSSSGRRLQSGSIQADFTVEVDGSDGEADEAQFQMETFEQDSSSFLTSAKSVMESKGIDSLSSSSVGSVSTDAEAADSPDAFDTTTTGTGGGMVLGGGSTTLMLDGGSMSLCISCYPSFWLLLLALAKLG